MCLTACWDPPFLFDAQAGQLSHLMVPWRAVHREMLLQPCLTQPGGDCSILICCCRLSKQRMLRSTLQVWHAAVALRREAVRIVDSSTAKREARQVSSCLEGWRQRLQQGFAFRSQLQQMGHACHLSLQGQVLSSWRDLLAMRRHHKVGKAITGS